MTDDSAQSCLQEVVAFNKNRLHHSVYTVYNSNSAAAAGHTVRGGGGADRMVITQLRVEELVVASRLQIDK